jgi:hypothetical protein
MTLEHWPRARTWYLGPLHIFRNPDAGVGLEVNGYRLFGPGQCGEMTFRCPGDRWCYLIYRHKGPHVETLQAALAALSAPPRKETEP